MKRSRSTAGFTLLELLIGMVIAGIVSTAIFGLLVGQLGGISNQSAASDTIDNARMAIDGFGQRAMMAGFGVAPGVVFGPSALSKAQNNSAGGDASNTCPGTRASS